MKASWDLGMLKKLMTAMKLDGKLRQIKREVFDPMYLPENMYSTHMGT